MFGKFEDEVNLSKPRYISSLYYTVPVHLVNIFCFDDRIELFTLQCIFLKIQRQAISKCIHYTGYIADGDVKRACYYLMDNIYLGFRPYEPR